MGQIAEFHLDEDAAAALAQRLAAVIRAGDSVLLEGGIGAGKTHFARHLILSLLPVPEDIPSPTFTLVQIYETPDFDIWHTDLYRLSSEDQVDELGLVDAMVSEVCLVEWPDRLGTLTPETALWLSFEVEDDGQARKILMTSDDATWQTRLAGVLA